MKGGREESFKFASLKVARYILVDLIFELMYSGYNPVGSWEVGNPGQKGWNSSLAAFHTLQCIV